LLYHPITAVKSILLSDVFKRISHSRYSVPFLFPQRLPTNTVNAPNWMVKGLVRAQGLISQTVVRRRIAKCRKSSGVHRLDYADQGML
jgi:hypothetical protein